MLCFGFSRRYSGPVAIFGIYEQNILVIELKKSCRGLINLSLLYKYNNCLTYLSHSGD